MNQFLGKALIRKGDRKGGTKSGERKIIIISGVFEVSEELYNSIDDRDEMWAVKFLEMESIKFANTKRLNFSPEDFLENTNDVQMPSLWTKK
jgi:hypothetical protein